MSTKQPRTTEGLTTFDDFLGEQGTREAFQVTAIKEVLAWQIKQAMDVQHLLQAELGKLMGG